MNPTTQEVETFKDFIINLLTRCEETGELDHIVTIESPGGHSLTLRIEVLDAALAGTSEAVH